MSTTSIFFNQSFDKKKLKAFIYWILKTFGEKKALTIIEELKSMGFSNATKAGVSISLHDLKTPSNKKFLISRAQIVMNKTDREFQGAEVTATERSQRIIDTWHRTSEDLRKQVVDYFSTYDQLNSVYMMALSGARGNFSQVRQLIGMRGLMADPQGQIISFPIRSNLREGLTLTEYFISCSGARKGLVDTALRTADTGYLTRRLVDISHHVVVKKVTCYTSRGIALKALRSSQKILLPLKDRLVGRVLGENIYGGSQIEHSSYNSSCKPALKALLRGAPAGRTGGLESNFRDERILSGKPLLTTQNNPLLTPLGGCSGLHEQTGTISQQTLLAKKNQEISPDLAFKISQIKAFEMESKLPFNLITPNRQTFKDKEHLSEFRSGILQRITKPSCAQVLVRSPLTCAYTHEVCQLCYGWSMAQGSLVSLGEAVGVIAGQSIGEPGTQLTMRTFHTGGVFSGDLLQEIRAPHSGKIVFPKALQGLLIRTSQGRIAFLIKVSGELLVDTGNITGGAGAHKTTKLSLEPSTILFVRQGEQVKSNQILAELAITTEEGNQPIKSRQTLFSEMSGRIVQWKSLLSKTHRTKGSLKGQNSGDDSPLFVLKYGYEARNNLFTTKSYGGNNILSPEGRGVVNVCSTRQTSFSKSETWDNVNDLTLKKIVEAKKHGFGSIEPPKALKLGLLSVIATRIGASEKTYTKLATNFQIKRIFKLKMRPPIKDTVKGQKLYLNRAPNVHNQTLRRRANRFANHRVNPVLTNSYLHPPTNTPEHPRTTRTNPIGVCNYGVCKKGDLTVGGGVRVCSGFLRPNKEFIHRIYGLSHLNTIAKQGDLVDKNYSKI